MRVRGIAETPSFFAAALPKKVKNINNTQWARGRDTYQILLICVLQLDGLVTISSKHTKKVVGSIPTQGMFVRFQYGPAPEGTFSCTT